MRSAWPRAAAPGLVALAMTATLPALGTDAPGLEVGVDAQAPPQPAGPQRGGGPAQPAIDISPRGAFLRNVALPGWGHAAIGAHTRGAFYFGVEAATAYTLLRSRRRLIEVRERLVLRETFLRDQLSAQGVEDPAEIESSLDEDGVVRELRSLEESRADQQEDMIAFGIFVLFLSGADAYVSAHLARFPAPLELEAEPLGDGGVELSLRLSLPR